MCVFLRHLDIYVFLRPVDMCVFLRHVDMYVSLRHVDMCMSLHPCITNPLFMCVHVRVHVHICACVSVCVCSCVCVCACVNIDVYFWERGGTGERGGAHGSTSIVEVTKPKRIAKVKQPVKKSTFACVPPTHRETLSLCLSLGRAYCLTQQGTRGKPPRATRSQPEPIRTVNLVHPHFFSIFSG